MTTTEDYGTWLHELEQASLRGRAVFRDCLLQSSIYDLARLEETRPGLLDKLGQCAQRVDEKRVRVEGGNHAA
jgi:hypothetical protein